MAISMADLTVGQTIGSRSIDVSRADLVRYAGASGDFNPIHWNDRFATDVGLPGVIAHGMFTMGAAIQLVTDWAGDPAAVVDYQTRFTKPVPVADADTRAGAVVEVTGTIGALDAEKSTARVDLAVTAGGQKVLVKAQAVVRLA
ncbi:MAG: MaoC family dehydratase [Actinomycetales bacterium]